MPDVAERWTVSKDGTVDTFQLRGGVKFHNKPPVNGREVAADNVKYSLDRIIAKSAFRTRFDPGARTRSIAVIGGRGPPSRKAAHSRRPMGQAMIYFRTDQVPFNDIRVRRAISARVRAQGLEGVPHVRRGCLDSGPAPAELNKLRSPSGRRWIQRRREIVGASPLSRRQGLVRVPAAAAATHRISPPSKDSSTTTGTV